MSLRTGPSATRQRFIRLGSRRTSVRLEDALWQALRDIAAEDGISVHELCARLHAGRRAGTYTSALRIFIVDRMRAKAAGEERAAVREPAKARARKTKPSQAARTARA